MSKTSRYVVTVDGGEPRPVDLVFTQADGRWSAELGGKQLEIRLDQVDPDGVIRVTIDGQAITLRMVTEPNGEIHLAPMDQEEMSRSVPVRVRSLGDVALEAATVRNDVPVPVHEPVLKAPITGIILKVLVKTGDQVEAGAPLLVLEAMKMETVVNSPCKGYVGAIHVAPDARVKTGDALIEISASEAGENTAIPTKNPV